MRPALLQHVVTATASALMQTYKSGLVVLSINFFIYIFASFFLHFLCCFLAQCCHQLSICKPACTPQYRWMCINASPPPATNSLATLETKSAYLGCNNPSAALQSKSATWCQAATINVSLLSITISIWLLVTCVGQFSRRLSWSIAVWSLICSPSLRESSDVFQQIKHI